MTTMKTRRDMEARSVAEQAAEWLLILEEDQAKDREAFADWLTQSPQHVGAFLRASALDSLLDEVDHERATPESESNPQADEQSNVVALSSRPLPAPAVPTARARSRFNRFAIAAAAAIVAVGAGVLGVHQISA